MKKTYYLIETASDRMGGGDSYTSMSEEELFKEKNKGYLDRSYITIYQKIDKKALFAKQKKIKKSPLQLKEEALEEVQHRLAMSHRAYRFSGPRKEVSEERVVMEAAIDRLEKEIKILKK